MLIVFMYLLYVYILICFLLLFIFYTYIGIIIFDNINSVDGQLWYVRYDLFERCYRCARQITGVGVVGQ